MIPRYKSLLLVWLLALLQCFVPLLHAHAGGLDVGGEAHIHLDALHLGLAHDLAELRIDHSAAPAVSAPSEFKRDSFLSGDDLLVAVNILPQPAMPAALRLQFAPTAYVPVFHQTTPPAQAPPAATRFL